MDGDTLSPDEVESLVAPHDFRQPRRATSEQVRAVHKLHEELGRNFALALRSLVRTSVDVKLVDVEQSSYAELLARLESPTCLNILRAEPIEGRLLLDVQTSILYPLMDRLLGGSGESGKIERRALTDIELRLARRITQAFLDELKQTWSGVQPIDPQLERVECDPRLAKIVAAEEVMLSCRYQLTLGDARGALRLCLPRTAVQTLIERLVKSPTPTAASQQVIAQTLDNSQVELVVVLAETKLTTSELLDLRVGDIIDTEQPVATPLSMQVEGVSKFRGKPGVFQGRKALCVEQSPDAATS